MAERILVEIEGGCPRCNQGIKRVLVDPDDPMHMRECPACGYQWSPMYQGPDGPVVREGAATYAGEFPGEPAPESAPAAEAPPVETP